jgi:hypothetical protein
MQRLLFPEVGGQAGSRLYHEDACGEVIGRLAPKGFIRRASRSRAKNVVRTVRRREGYGCRCFLSWSAFSYMQRLLSPVPWAASMRLRFLLAARAAPFVASACSSSIPCGFLCIRPFARLCIV